MKTHTSGFKDNIKKFGRELSSKITYELNGETIELGPEELNSITPHYKSALLKSTMKQLDIDSNVEIPVGTIVNYQFGVKVGNAYEYVNYGNYIVKEIEKQEDTYSWKITCYDKMLYAMKDYEELEITYPTTVREYITAICTKLGLTFKNANEQFVNYNKVIPEELYISTEGQSLGYTFRDVLDQLAETTASTICINEDDDELEIRYIHDAGEEATASGNNITITNGEDAELVNFEMEGKTTQETRSGKNILPSLNTTRTINGITFTKNNDGSITINGTATGNAVYPINVNSTSNLQNIPIKNNTQYTLSCRGITSGITMQAYYNATYYTAPQTFTSISTVLGAYVIVSNGKTINNVTIYPQLEEGSTATEYEQYGAMPSPDYPSELVSVGYANLFDSATFEANLVSGKIRDNSGTVVNDSTSTYSTYMMPIKANKKYNIKGFLQRVYLLNSSGTFVSRIIYNSSNTLPMNTTYTPTIDGYFQFQIRNDIYNSNKGEELVYVGTQAHSYIPYSKYGIEVISTKEILLDKLWEQKSFNYLTGELGTSTTTNIIRSGAYEVKPNTQYTFKCNANLGEIAVFYYQEDKTTVIQGLNGYTNNKYWSFKTPSNAYYVYIRIGSSTSPKSATTNYDQKLEENNVFLYTLNQPLRSIGDTKDLLYIKNGMLYVERKIGSATFKGTETWNLYSSNTVRTIFYTPISQQMESYTLTTDIPKLMSSHFIPASQNATWKNGDISRRTNENNIYLIVANGYTIDTFKTWLSTHNTEVQYILASSNTEGLGKIEVPSTYKTITYIDIEAGIEATANIKYINEFEEIDEEFLKDVNVNFGEKFGPINTVVLSRSGGSDKIAQSIPENIADEDKIAIEISENQIMNDNNRADFIPEILNKLKGIEYYMNDFTSTGIAYLNLYDRYRIKVFENKYKCIMLNDEANITQGLQESIFTEMPEKAETEYKNTSKDDRMINQTYILAKKNEGTIEAVVESVSGEEGLEKRVQRVETKQTATDLRVDVIGTHIDQTTGDVREVKTSTGFTFNAEGMTIEDSTSNFKALHRNTGTYYYDGNVITGQYTKDGSKQKDLELFGVYYYGKNDINETPMFVAQLFTDNNGVEGVGHFYNGGD